jgi:hypothetical protein
VAPPSSGAPSKREVPNPEGEAEARWEGRWAGAFPHCLGYYFDGLAARGQGLPSIDLPQWPAPVPGYVPLEPEPPTT